MSRMRMLLIIVIALLLVATGVVYYYTNVYLQAQAPVEEETITTYTVTRGDLIITASGSGTLVPASESGAGFQNGGVLAEVLGEVGDTVEAGQVLARLDNTDARDEVAQAEISLRQAELDLAELLEEADAAEVAAAEATLSSAKASLTALTSPPDAHELLAAQESLSEAQEALQDLLDLPDPDEVEIAKASLTLAEMKVRTAQAAYDKISWKADVGTSQEAADLWEATTNYEQAEAEYQEALEGASEDDLAASRAQVALAQAELNALQEDPDPDELAAAQAQVTQAQAELELLLAGASSEEKEKAELSVAQAQLELDSAQRALDETMLVAPISGIVTSIEAEVGEAVGSDAIITLADLAEPVVQFWIEEADLSSVAPGNRVEIVFEALPDYTYPGEIVSVDPALVDVDGTPAVQAYASVDLSTHPFSPLSGMNAEIEVIAGETHDAVLVPVQALREVGVELADQGQAGESRYAVFVVGADGDLEMRIVEVGLKDYVDAEILAGLEAGETISLGTTTSSNASTAPATGGQQQGPPMGMPMFGP